MVWMEEDEEKSLLSKQCLVFKSQTFCAKQHISSGKCLASKVLDGKTHTQKKKREN